MVLPDVRCRDAARILAAWSKSRREIGAELNKLYPALRPRGSWIHNVLLSRTRCRGTHRPGARGSGEEIQAR